MAQLSRMTPKHGTVCCARRAAALAVCVRCCGGGGGELRRWAAAGRGGAHLVCVEVLVDAVHLRQVRLQRRVLTEQQRAEAAQRQRLQRWVAVAAEVLVEPPRL